jgi:cell division protein FtsW (lipid II flippase)
MPDRTQRRLLTLAALFLGVSALALSLSPAVWARSWEVDFRWGHWIGYAVWLAGFGLVHQQSKARLPSRDPLLLPLVALLSGWGALTVWRLSTTFGLRQSIWLALILAGVAVGLRLPSDLNFLRRYKYLWLTSGLLLTASTLVFGTHPMGTGPDLWLGCCGVYFQPSEPLKLLLVVYLAAYFADLGGQLSNFPSAGRGSRSSQDDAPRKEAASGERVLAWLDRPSSLPLLIPTFVMTGLALLLLLAQRDLGTVSLFIFLYSVMVFVATGWRWVAPISGLGLVLAGVIGYQLFDVVRLRVDAWINPWLDPSGRSYQIVQSLLAVANGGLLGRGPGLGSPGVVPVAHSDFVYAAIAEESGLIGTIALVLVLGLLAQRGLRSALGSADPFRRYLAAGLSAYLVAQSVLIIGGNLRMLPLTGVTLPFVSYGGSSLLVSFLAVLLLLHISSGAGTADRKTHTAHADLRSLLAVRYLAAFLFLSLAAAALVSGWWAFYRGPDLLTRTDNPRRAIADRYVHRGALLDRYGSPLVETSGQIGEYRRRSLYPLGSVLGYSHPVYGQSGLEASLDSYLRGTRGRDAVTLLRYQVLYGQPPPGLDVRLTIDLALQRAADERLTGQRGALVLLDVKRGEILALASSPTFDPDDLDTQWERLIEDPAAPLLNRVTQGRYPLGDLVAEIFPGGALEHPAEIVPQIRLPVGETGEAEEGASPLQVALAAAALSNAGVRPVARIAQAVREPAGGWVLLPSLGSSKQILSPDEARAAAARLALSNEPIWQLTMVPADEALTWYAAGTLPEWDAAPLVMVLVLEEQNPPLAEQIGGSMLLDAMGP